MGYSNSPGPSTMASGSATTDFSSLPDMAALQGREGERLHIVDLRCGAGRDYLQYVTNPLGTSRSRAARSSRSTTTESPPDTHNRALYRRHNSDTPRGHGAYLGAIEAPDRVLIVGEAGGLVFGDEKGALDDVSLVAYRLELVGNA